MSITGKSSKNSNKGMEACREFLEPMLLVTLFAPASQLSAAAALAALYYFVLAHQVRCHQMALHQNDTEVCTTPKCYCGA